MSPGGEVDLDDLRLLIAALADLEDGADLQDTATRRVAIVMELKTLTDQSLHDCIERAREDNVSWQQIGDVLGISRQAAFQRFRDPSDSKGNSNQMRTKNNNELVPKAEAIYHHLKAGDYAAVANEMTFVTQRMLPEKKVMSVWSGAQAAFGQLESLGESTVRPSGRNAVVVETPVAFEAGDLVGRIAYNKRNKIVGMLILEAEDLPSAPF